MAPDGKQAANGKQGSTKNEDRFCNRVYHDCLTTTHSYWVTVNRYKLPPLTKTIVFCETPKVFFES